MPTHRIGNYRLDRVLGTGSFATVWLAYDERLDAPVAVKILADNWARNPEIRHRFIDEARLLRRIDDDRIVRVYAVDDLPDGRPYFVMAWADRGTLLGRMAATAPPHQWPLADAVDIALGITECLAVVHAFGVIHRDVKPSNVLFRSIPAHQRAGGAQERVVLGDFGLAKDVVSDTGFTVPAGTPAYMAPEQARSSAALDVRADLFAATAVLFELLMGRPAYAADTLSAARAGTRPTPSRLASGRPELPTALQEVLDRGLDPDPAGRYGSAAELATAIRRAAASPGPGAGPSTVMGDPTTGRGVPMPLHGARPSPAPAQASPEPGWAGAAEGSWGPPAGEDAADRAASAGPVAAPGLLRPRAGWLSSRASLAGVTPLVAVRTLLGEAQSVLPGSSSHWDQAAGLLAAPLRVIVVGGADADHTEALAASLPRFVVGTPATGDRSAVVVSVASAEAEPPADVVILAGGGDADAGVELPIHGRAAADGPRPGGPVAVFAPASLDAGPAIAPAAAECRAWLQTEAERWWDTLRAARALDVVDTGLGRAGASPSVDRLRGRAEMLRLAHPGLAEVAVLADEAGGRLQLPAGLRLELRRVLSGRQPWERLGVDPATDGDELSRLGAEGAGRWRAMTNSGRIPFAARGAAATVARAYDRLATGSG